MKSVTFSLKKSGLALITAVFAMGMLAPAASAQTYYYQPVSMPYQYQQPVYYYQYPTYQNQAVRQQQLRVQLQNLWQQLTLLQNQYRLIHGHSYTGGGGSGEYTRNNRDYDIDVDTLYARDVEDDEATLYGDLDLDDAPYADVWFEYGEDGELDEDTRKMRENDDGRFSIDLDDLDEDERYYFRAVAEDSNGDRAYGQIKSFEADDYNGSGNDDDAPDVETESARDITDDSAELRGEVDMNDFDNGDVFFVWGEDEDLIEDVEDEDRYSNVDEEGDDLQKYRVYNDLDGFRSFWLEVFGLDDNTDHYFRICVEYEDEDDDDTIECGDVEDFETDN